jgi:hypothetical protein
MMQVKDIYNSSATLKQLYGCYYFLTEKFFGYRKEKKRFFIRKGYKPDLNNPRSFCEKLVWKKINDRNPLLRVTADKYRVRSYITQLLGQERAGEILIPLLHVTDNPNTIPFDDLPDSYIAKANHGSGWNIIVDGNDKTREEVIANCKKWLSTPYGLDKHEWAYQKIKRLITIEELLKDQNKLPNDYKFYVFHGICRLVRVSFSRFNDAASSNFNRNWTFIPLTHRTKKQGPIIDKPKNYDTMLSLAEELAQDFDFVRVDLYNIDGKIFFGELTHYPGSGSPSMPADFDFELGRHWELIPEYWTGNS